MRKWVFSKILTIVVPHIIRCSWALKQDLLRSTSSKVGTSRTKKK